MDYRIFNCWPLLINSQNPVIVYVNILCSLKQKIPTEYVNHHHTSSRIHKRANLNVNDWIDQQQQQWKKLENDWIAKSPCVGKFRVCRTYDVYIFQFVSCFVLGFFRFFIVSFVCVCVFRLCMYVCLSCALIHCRCFTDQPTNTNSIDNRILSFCLEIAFETTCVSSELDIELWDHYYKRSTCYYELWPKPFEMV